MIRYLILPLVLWLLSSCSDKANTGSELFPLQAGREWVYSVLTEMEDGSNEKQSLKIRNLPSEEYESKPAFRRETDWGVNYWFRADETGIRRVAMKSEIDPEPVRDDTARYVLKQPYVVGTLWTHHTAPYLLMRRADFPREIRHTHPKVPMNYSIAAIDQVVKTPAGEWKGCLMVEGLARINLYADPVVGWKNIPLETKEWYCPGMGLVKMVRTEAAKSQFLMGGSTTLELVAWK